MPNKGSALGKVIQLATSRVPYLSIAHIMANGNFISARTKTDPLTTVSVTIFLYFNLKQKTVSTNKVGLVRFFGEILYKKPIILLCYKLCENISKQIEIR
jgi:hypothetical protein